MTQDTGHRVTVTQENSDTGHIRRRTGDTQRVVSGLEDLPHEGQIPSTTRLSVCRPLSEVLSWVPPFPATLSVSIFVCLHPGLLGTSDDAGLDTNRISQELDS